MTNSAESATSPFSPSALFLRAGNFFFRVRNMLFPILFAVVFLTIKPELFLGSRIADQFAMAVGVAIALLGQLFRFSVIGFAYIRRGGKDRKVYADDLVTGGIFAHCRNPMYVGNLLIAAGVCIVYGASILYYLVFPFFLFVYLSIVAAEENFLRKKFGEQFEKYCKQVPRFGVKFRGMRETLDGFTFDWKKALRKEYGTLFSTFAGLNLLILWKEYQEYGLQGSETVMFYQGLLFIPLFAFYLTVRYLKNHGVLGEKYGS